jgi:hypothetical protein
VIDAASMVKYSEVMAATVPDAIPTVIATKVNGVLVSQGEVSQPPSVDQMVQDLKRKIGYSRGVGRTGHGFSFCFVRNVA